MVKQLLNKFVVILIILILTSGNLMLIGTEAYAEFENLEEQKKESSDKNVSFDSYFVVEENEIHSVTLDAKSEAYVNFEINIQNGYLKESVIELNNASFEIENIEQQNIEGIVKSSTSNKIELNQINSNNKVIITAKIKMHRQEYVEANYCSKETTVSFTSNYTNIKGVTKQINAGINVAINWVTEISSNIETNVTKYMQYGEKTIIETNVISSLNDNVLPIKNTNINIIAPKIQENLPEEVRIHANSTVVTNGKVQENFSTQNWSYNKETGEITINVENQANEEGKIAWKTGTDEYVVTYIYNTTELINQIELNAKSTITTYTENTIENSVNNVQGIAISGNYIDYNIIATEKTNKGYIYANSIYETPYKETISANISYKDATEGLVFVKGNEIYNLDNNKKIQANSYYKNTIISKVNFEKILGQEGKINIYNAENLVATIDNNTQADESGNLIYNYQEKYNNIRIETTEPIEEGKLAITNNKVLEATNTYDYNIQRMIRNIETTLIGASTNQEVQTKNAITNLEETTSKAQVTISKTDLSTVVTNENVELRAILETDDITDDLYQNPTIRIEMPEDIEKINIKSVNVLFNDEMKVATINIENGRIINLALEGNQTQYVTNNNKGITIIINTDIIVNKTATTKETQVTMNYSNQKAINLENGGVATTPVNIAAPVGLIALNSVINTTTGETATSLKSNEEKANLERNIESQTATYTNTIINNNNETISSVKILGNIASKDDSCGSTINAKFISEIKSLETLNYTVYYSENAEATTDLNNSQNKWTQEITENTKVYLIEINEDVEQGKELNFAYNIELPEKLEYGAKAISTYKVEYTEGSSTSGQIASINGAKAVAYVIAEQNEQTSAILSEQATPVTLTTGSGPVLEATLEDDTVDGTVYVGQVVTYTLNITNKGTADAENVKINVPVPEGMVYVEKEVHPEDGNTYIAEKENKTIEKNVENIKVNETKKIELMLKAKEIKDKVEVYAQIENKYGNIETNRIEHKINDSNFEINLMQSNGELKIGEEIQYLITIKNNSDEKQDNVNVNVVLPENLELKSIKVKNIDEEITSKVQLNNKNNNIDVKIPEINGKDITYVYLNTIANNEIKDGIMYASISTKDIKNQLTNKNIIKILKPTGEVEVLSEPSEGYVKVGDILNYNIKIKNTSQNSILEIIQLDLPSEFSIIDKKINGEEIKENSYIENKANNEFVIYDNIESQENSLISLKIQINNELELTEDRTEKVTIKTNEIVFEKILNYIIEKNIEEELEIEPDDPDIPINPDEPDNPVNPSEDKKYKITGIAWLDSDKSGSLEENENKLQGITVKAIDENGNIKATTKTSENGTYTLEGLEKGKYIVIFEYDSSKYILTTYQKEGISDSINSNVIKGTYEGKTVATTNNIEILDRSIANINIGLIEGSNFDLSLTKKVKQISMANTKKTKTTKYDTQLAKIDLDYKYINNTKVAIEYEITITNEGDIPGYASKIVDYLPEGFDFSTELNKDWYTSNKNIETRELANTIIKPGESQTITLVLTKSMNENGNGIYCNTAEISEDYNEYGQADSDSIPGNNKEGEDDQSSANVILGLKTGGPVIYVTLTLSIMALICISAYEINKRVLKF